MNTKNDMAQIKTCMVSGSYPPMEDGVAEYMQRLLTAMKKDFKNIQLITTRNNGSSGNIEEDVFAVVEKWTFRKLPGIIKQIRKRKPNIVHIQYPTHGYGRNVAANFLPIILRVVMPRTKLVSTIHEFTTRTFKGRSRLLASIIPSHRIIIVDRQYKKDIGKYWPFIGKRMFHVPVGSNVPDPSGHEEFEVRQLREKLGIKETSPVISYFGAVRPLKGIEILLRSFYGVLQKYPEAKLLFIGRIYEDYYENSIKGMVADEGLDSAVIFTGPCEQDEISLYFSLVDMCVLPFPDGVSTKRTSFMAALQHDLPTITTGGEFLPEGLVDYENVVLLEYGDEAALSEKMVELIGDEELRNKLRSNAAKVLEHYSWDSIAARNINVYRSLFG